MKNEKKGVSLDDDVHSQYIEAHYSRGSTDYHSRYYGLEDGNSGC